MLIYFKKILENNVNIITLLLICLILYIGIYQYIISILFFRVFFYLKTFPYIQDKLKIFKEDQLTIADHWKKDKDLIIITYICRFLYLIGISILCYFLSYIRSLETEFLKVLLSGGKNIEELLLPWHMEILLFVGCSLILCGLLLTFIAETHIIFYRNTPVKAKILHGYINCAKTMAVIAGVGIPIVDGVSNSFVVQPNLLTNTYQKSVPWGRGYGYESTFDMIIDDSLKSSSIYDKAEFIDVNTKNFSIKKANVFVENNKEYLTKELSVPSCLTLGLKKGWVY